MRCDNLKILFIYNGAEHFGIEFLSAFLKNHGHETSLLFDPAPFSTGAILITNKFLSRIFDLDDEIIVKKAIKGKPDLIAFSCITQTYRWSLNLAEKIRQQSDIPIVFGGIHPSSVPEEVMQHNFIDYVIVGEGEYALLELLEHLDGNDNKTLSKVQNLVYRSQGKVCNNPVRGYIKDLDSIPFPDKSLFVTIQRSGESKLV